MTTIKSIVARDVRFPTSRSLDGSDAMNEAPDYSATYVTVETSAGDQGHGMTFTTGAATSFAWQALKHYQNY